MMMMRLASLSAFFLATLLVALPWLAPAAEQPSDPAAAAGQRAGSPVPEGIDNEAAVREETCGYLDRNTTVKPEAWDDTCPADCPFEPSPGITGLVFTGCYANYTANTAPGQPEGVRYAAHFREVELQTGAGRRSGGLTISDLGKIGAGLSARDEQEGTEAKWACVRTLLGAGADRVIIKQVSANLGGNTSVRNQLPLVWKDKGYFQRARDLGQAFTAPHDFAMESIVLRTGNGSLAFQSGAAGAEAFVQFFEVTGTPAVDDNGTPPGTQAKHGFSPNHRCDDVLTGVQYKPLAVVTGGRLPDLATRGDGKLTYMKWTFTGDAAPRFERGRRYAFMVGFVAPAAERNFTLANWNNAASPRPPALADADDTYPGGWGLRREGNGVTPPRMIAGERPPGDRDALHQLQAEATFPTGEARYAMPPTCDGYPDVDTYRDLEFYLLEHAN